MFNIGDRVVFKNSDRGTEYIVKDGIWDDVLKMYMLGVKADDGYNSPDSPNGWFLENLFNKVEEEKKMKFKVGDTVKVVRKVEKQNGWNNNWTDDMNNYIGISGTITVATEEYGYEIDNRYSYPESALELVVEKPVNTDRFNIDRGVKYQYFTFGKLTLTIGTHIIRNANGDAKVKWAVTFKNPKDQFSKQMAREVLSNSEWKTLFVEKGYTRDNIVMKILCDVGYNLEHVSNSYREYILALLSTYSREVYLNGIYK